MACAITVSGGPSTKGIPTAGRAVLHKPQPHRLLQCPSALIVISDPNTQITTTAGDGVPTRRGQQVRDDIHHVQLVRISLHKRARSWGVSCREQRVLDRCVRSVAII